jgi:hypothetical protein
VGELKVKISGCINACGHHHVGHIGILGVDKKGEEFYQLTLGGSGAEDAAVGSCLGPALPYDRVADAVDTLVDVYLRERQDGERFLDTFRRTGVAPSRRPSMPTRIRLRTALRAGRGPFTTSPTTRIPPGDVILSLTRFQPTATACSPRAAGRRAAGEPTRRSRRWPTTCRAGGGGAGVPEVRRRARLQQRRLLRERYGFKGEVRAVGDVLREQAGFMVRCGFDAFEPADGSTLDEWDRPPTASVTSTSAP